MNFDAFNKRTLQSCKLLVDKAVEQGLDIEQLKKLLDDELKQEPVDQNPTGPAIEKRKCPSCGKLEFKDRIFKGYTRPVMWCYSCTYSEEIK